MRRTDALIVGGGPAGSAAAIALARRGLSPLVIERDAEPQDHLCGGFLSWATVARLRALGVEPLDLGGRVVRRVRIVARDRQAVADLPGPAVALSRFRLDRALLARAAADGAGIERGCAARGLDEGRVRLAGGGTLEARAVVIATGKRDLRGVGRRTSGDQMMGLRWRLRPTPGLDRLVGDAIELHLFDGGYAGLVRQEDNVNLCLAIDTARMRHAGGRPDDLLAALAVEMPALADRLARAAAVGPAQAVANIPYGWRAVRGAGAAFRIGDQCAVIASLAGEGVAIALASGEAVAEAIGRGGFADDFQRDFARRARRPVAAAGLFCRIMERPGPARLATRALARAPALVGAAARLTRL